MDADWSDGAAAVSGGESKAGAAGGVSSSADCPGSPVPPAPPSSPAAGTTGTGRRRSANKRVVTLPLADVSGPRPKGVGEGNTPTDSWAWRKYGQKPIKGSPFPRAYYRCSSSKGCPARKQVERSRAEPDKVIVTYSFEHNHSDAVARAAQNRQPQAPKPKAAQQPAVPPEPAAESPSSGSHDVVVAATVCAGGAPAAAAETEVGAAAAVEVRDEFRWLYDGVSVTSSASPSDVEAADEMLYGATMFFGAGASPAAPLPDEFGDVGGLFDYGEAGGEEDAMFAGLGELPECTMVFRRHAGDGLSVAGGVK